MASKVRAGDRFQIYEVRARLGRGGNGEVWRVVDDTGAERALKVLTRGGHDAQARFRREVDLQRGVLSGLLGLLPVLDASEEGDPPWLVMPIAEPIGRALAESSLDEVLGAAADVAATLGRLHGLGYAHRDVKPGNLYKFEGQWVVGDLGLVDLPEPTPLTVGRRALGPKWFLAPEMLSDPEGAAGGTADVYSLAKTLWVLMVGSEFPPPGTHIRQVPALRPSSFVQHPRGAFLDRLLERATAHEPGDRPSADEVSQELRLIIEGSTMSASDEGGPDLVMLRGELRLASETSTRGEASRRDRLAAGQQLVQDLVLAGDATRDVLVAAGAPLAAPYFGDNQMVLERANNWSLRNSEARFGQCLVATLQYETGLIGPNRIGEVHLWSGFGVVTTAEGEAVIVAAHIVEQSIVWTDNRLVHLESMEAQQAVNDVATGLRDHVPEGLAAFLAAYKRATRT